jgi:hypothetical protein
MCISLMSYVDAWRDGQGVEAAQRAPRRGRRWALQPGSRGLRPQKEAERVRNAGANSLSPPFTPISIGVWIGDASAGSNSFSNEALDIHFLKRPPADGIYLFMRIQ